MESAVAQSTSRPISSDFSSLSPEILLSIFLNLSSDEIVNFRRTCKKWLEVIDTNKSLWRNLEWIGKSKESIEKAIELFDEKSASTLETISIEEHGEGSRDLQQLVAIISRSNISLKSATIFVCRPPLITRQLLELASSLPKLEKLVSWDASEHYRKSLPVTHVVPNKNKVDVGSPASHLKVLWVFVSWVGDINQILDLPDQLLSSLISFALHAFHEFQEIRPLLAHFSDSIVHLRLTITADEEPRIHQPLFCPNLKILEGTYPPRVSLYFDCPNLKHLIVSIRRDFGLRDIPSSVEQLWLESNPENLVDEIWDPLLSSCPNMEVLKLKQSKYRNQTDLQPEPLIQVLEKRQEIIKKGDEIQGLRVLPLQSLVLSLSLLSKDQLERARKVAVEVVDIHDYPNFIELEY